MLIPAFLSCTTAPLKYTKLSLGYWLIFYSIIVFFSSSAVINVKILRVVLKFPTLDKKIKISRKSSDFPEIITLSILY